MNRRAITVYLPNLEYSELEKFAKELQTSISDSARILIRDGLRGLGKV